MSTKPTEPCDPLPLEWDIDTLRGSKITLYQYRISPPCCKMRFLLDFYKVPYTVVDGKKPDSEYAKVPVLDIGDKLGGSVRQINDSYNMVKVLAPILQGRPLTDDELELESEVTYGLMISMEKATSGNCKELCACGTLLGDCSGCLLSFFSICICCLGPRKFPTSLQSIKVYGQILQDHLGAGQYFGGGEEPSIIDCSVYGLLQPWDKVQSVGLAELLGSENDPLHAWHERMRAVSPHVNIWES